jgi:hypothetical protein
MWDMNLTKIMIRTLIHPGKEKTIKNNYPHYVEPPFFLDGKVRSRKTYKMRINSALEA